MHHKGGVSKTVKFSLAGNTEATTAAVEKERAATPVLVFNRGFISNISSGEIRCRLDPGSTRLRSGHISPHFI